MSNGFGPDDEDFENEEYDTFQKLEDSFDKIFEEMREKGNIKEISLETEGKIIVMSDVHMGDGSWADDFAHNSNLYKVALDYYFNNGFLYIELGDAEELWENKVFHSIFVTHGSIYLERLKKFHDAGRYIKVWGNHDLDWSEEENVKKYLHPLFSKIKTYEAVLIDKTILFLHGHQADPKCNEMGAWYAKPFVRYVWSYLQKWGARDPTRAANNPGRMNNVDKLLHHWANNNNKGIKTILAGHTHRSVFKNLTYADRIKPNPKPEDPSYYNDGSCVHPRCITGIEITKESTEPNYKLVKWHLKPTQWPKEECKPEDSEGLLSVFKEILEPRNNS